MGRQREKGEEGAAWGGGICRGVPGGKEPKSGCLAQPEEVRVE